MNRRNIIKALLYLSALVAVVSLQPIYEKYTEELKLATIFKHTLYRSLIALLLVESAKQLILLTYRSSNPQRKKDNFIIGINHISKILYVFLIGALLLALLNISIKEAFTSLSLIAAAVVLMTKDYISNLINGMYLTFAGVINVGDQVSIDGAKGKILDITLTNVHLLNEDDDIIFVPNNKVFSSEIINYTRRNLKKTSIDFEVDPMIISDIWLLEKKLLAMMAPYTSDIQTGSFNLKTVSIKKDSIALKFQYVLVEPLNKEMDKKVKKHALRQIASIINSPLEKE